VHYAVLDVNPQIREFYRELGLESGANLASIRQSYLQLVKVWHPDRFGNDHKLQLLANDKLKMINLAYESLVAFIERAEGSEAPAQPRAEATPKTDQASPATEIYYAGLERCRLRDYKGALDLLLRAAEMNDSKAQYAYGFLLYNGHGNILNPNRHFATILRWWTKAAEQGHVDAQYMVGTFHQTGFSTPFDEEEARKWFQRAASKGHSGARERLNKLGVLNKINAIPIARWFVGDTPPRAPTPK
jgi:hypothetical protein